MTQVECVCQQALALPLLTRVEKSLPVTHVEKGLPLPQIKRRKTRKCGGGRRWRHAQRRLMQGHGARRCMLVVSCMLKETARKIPTCTHAHTHTHTHTCTHTYTNIHNRTRTQTDRQAEKHTRVRNLIHICSSFQSKKSNKER